ncbi:hypothetical protein CsSME_00014653 [Camellia sinensis var. sinensis]
MWLINLSAGSTLLYSWTICSAGIFVLVALVLSMYLIFEHLAAYYKPEEQKFLIGLILMVPVYALESFLSLLNSNVAFNCEIIRDCYEAFALYCFERYLIACLGIHTWQLLLILVRPGRYIASYSSIQSPKISWRRLNLWPNF